VLKERGMNMPTSLGLVGITNKGNYDAQTTYVKGNFVYYNGSTWLLKAATATGIEPNENNSATWQYLAKGFNVLPFGGATASTDGTGGTVPQPHAGDEDKVLQGNGTFGKKLQMDVVVQNNQYGYINGSNQFVAFKSQADIDAAVSAAKVGDATAADVLSGKTFTNATTSGLTGAFKPIALITTKCFSGKNLNTSTWSSVVWSGELGNDFSGQYTWTDGNRIYYSNGSDQYVLDVSARRWDAMTWNGLTEFSADNIWTDGDNIYYSNGSDQYVLNKSTFTWSAKTWSGGLSEPTGVNIWTDGDDIYWTYMGNTFKLDKSTSSWTVTSFRISANGSDIFSMNGNTYYTRNHTVKKFDKANSTWVSVSWSAFINTLNVPVSSDIWTDGNGIYLSTGEDQLVFSESSNNWVSKTWNGFTGFRGGNIWTDGNDIYYSTTGAQYVLDRKTYSKK
jgi:hypothetical protein